MHVFISSYYMFNTFALQAEQQQEIIGIPGELLPQLVNSEQAMCLHLGASSFLES